MQEPRLQMLQREMVYSTRQVPWHNILLRRLSSSKTAEDLSLPVRSESHPASVPPSHVLAPAFSQCVNS